jgi:SAM-dependent methyltransferase
VAITGRMSELYDVFVDWEGRLGRELPGILRHLESVGAERVLDVGCGTGRHAAALLERGYDAHGVDVSADMRAQAVEAVGDAARVHDWRLGEAPPESVRAPGSFDAVICMGNVWPSILSDADVSGACAGIREVLRPGGLLVLGCKAQGVRKAGGDPYLPLLRRVHQGRPLWFVRFVDFERPPLADGTEVCDLHMTIVAGDAEDEAPEALHHSAGAQRVWLPDELRARFEAEGFTDVRVSGRLDDPRVPPPGEDVFVSARAS